MGSMAPPQFSAYGELEVELYFTDYAREITAAGGLPVHLPLAADPAALAERLDGLVLSGGSDVDPGLYGQGRDRHTVVDERRDAFELRLLAAAEKRRIPVLAICRGLHLVNVVRGGSLHQHLPEHARYDAPAEVVHRVELAGGARLHELLGASVGVNSMHHQTIDRLGEGIVPVGWAEDGQIEAVEVPGTPTLGVQWHPEKIPSAATRALFTWVVAEARARA
jgi:putative glutamine amidotransferase